MIGLYPKMSSDITISHQRSQILLEMFEEAKESQKSKKDKNGKKIRAGN